MQSVSTTFSGYLGPGSNSPTTGALVSWTKQTASGIKYFTIGSSSIGGNDIIKSTGVGTVAAANQYAYTAIAESGIVSWSTSFKFDQQPYGLVQRQAELVLSNASGQYLPASGTTVGSNMNSNRPLIISAGFGNETIPMFTGYTDSPQQDLSNYTTVLHAYDAITFLKSYLSTATAVQLGVKADQIIANLLTEAGFSPSQYVLESSLASKIAYLDPYNLFIGDIIQSLCEAEGGMFFADESGILHFWNRQHFANNKTPVATLTYSNIRDLAIQNAPIINNVQIVSTPEVLVSGTINNVYSLSQPYYLQAGSIGGINAVQNPSLESNSNGWLGMTRQNALAYNSTWSASGTVVSYSGMPVRGNNGNIYYSGNPGSIGGTINAQAEVFAPKGNFYHVQLKEYNSTLNSWSVFSDTVYSGTGAWQNVSFNYPFSNFTNVFNNAGDIYFTVSGTGPYLVDALSDNTSLPYFDGNTPSTNISTYTWSGTTNNSMSLATAVPQYLNLNLQLSQNVYSLIAPVASGLNNPSIGPQQSYYSFSTASGINGIYGQDATSNVTLLSYATYGNTASLVFRNNTTTQAYLTNLVLYGQTAQFLGQITEQYYDSSSMTNYGMNPVNNGMQIQISNDYVQSTSDALALAEYLVQSFKKPLLRVTSNVFAQPQLQFGDLVNLVNSDTGETRQMYVVGIDNALGKNTAFTQKLTLQERNIANYFTIGTSKIGGTDQIAP